MITSALISQSRREFGDIGKTTQVAKAGDGSSTVFNVGKFPVIEGSYTVLRGTSALVEGSGYNFDLDNGDLTMLFTPSTAQTIKSRHKYAHWRDKNWVEAFNQGIEELNARGFFRQVTRNTSIFRISANIRTYSGPSAAVDVYEILLFDNRTISGGFVKPTSNWAYHQDANKIIFGNKPTIAQPTAISYLRNMQTYSATSATLDVANDWIEAVKKFAGSKYYRSLAGKIAKQGAATVDEGHFSFTNLRTQANDLLAEFNDFSRRKKPTRPAKNIEYHAESGGVA